MEKDLFCVGQHKFGLRLEALPNLKPMEFVKCLAVHAVIKIQLALDMCSDYELRKLWACSGELGLTLAVEASIETLVSARHTILLYSSYLLCSVQSFKICRLISAGCCLSWPYEKGAGWPH